MTILGKEFGFLARGRARAGDKVGQAGGEHVLDILFASVGVSHVTRDVLLVGRAEPDCLEGGTHEETLRPQVNPKVLSQRFRGAKVLS